MSRNFDKKHGLQSTTSDYAWEAALPEFTKELGHISVGGRIVSAGKEAKVLRALELELDRRERERAHDPEPVEKEEPPKVMKKPIMISRPPSGVSVYLTEGQAEILGGLGTKVEMDWEPETRTFTLKRSNKPTGVSLIKNGDSLTHPVRAVCISANYAVVNKMTEQFAPSRIAGWHSSDGVITFKVPPIQDLDPPIIMSRSSTRKVHEVEETDPVRRLGIAIRELNDAYMDLVTSGTPVEIFYVPDDPQGGTAVKLPQNFILKGRVIRTEELG